MAILDYPLKANLLERLRSIDFHMGPGLRRVLTFTDQLAVMIQAGIGISDAIEGITQQTEHRRFRGIITQIRADLEAGSSFSEALDRYPSVFPPLYINMIRASELSGNLPETLERIAGYLDHRHETRGMVIGAMMYPGVIAVMAVTTSIFLLAFVLPKFTALFAGKEHLLPVPTKMLMATSDFIRAYWYLLVAGGIALGVSFRFAINTPAGRERWDRAKLRIPLLKRVFKAFHMTHSMHAMSDLMAAGVPILETLRIIADISGSSVYKRMWLSISSSVRQGRRIVTALADEALLPTVRLQPGALPRLRGHGPERGLVQDHGLVGVQVFRQVAQQLLTGSLLEEDPLLKELRRRL